MGARVFVSPFSSLHLHTGEFLALSVRIPSLCGFVLDPENVFSLGFKDRTQLHAGLPKSLRSQYTGFPPPNPGVQLHGASPRWALNCPPHPKAVLRPLLHTRCPLAALLTKATKNSHKESFTLITVQALWPCGCERDSNQLRSHLTTNLGFTGPRQDRFSRQGEVASQETFSALVLETVFAGKRGSIQSPTHTCYIKGMQLPQVSVCWEWHSNPGSD